MTSNGCSTYISLITKRKLHIIMKKEFPEYYMNILLQKGLVLVSPYFVFLSLFASFIYLSLYWNLYREEETKQLFKWIEERKWGATFDILILKRAKIKKKQWEREKKTMGRATYCVTINIYCSSSLLWINQEIIIYY